MCPDCKKYSYRHPTGLHDDLCINQVASKQQISPTQQRKDNVVNAHTEMDEVTCNATGTEKSVSIVPVRLRSAESEVLTPCWMLAVPVKSHGLYSCPTRLLKCSRHIISAPLATLINNSVQRGISPSKLKHAKIIPIFKDGDEAEPGNYRPISLISVFNRLFQKIMYNRLEFCFSKHCLFYKSQYGFRKQR